jgi:hypothetical protein
MTLNTFDYIGLGILFVIGLYVLAHDVATILFELWLWVVLLFVGSVAYSQSAGSSLGGGGGIGGVGSA